MTGPAGRDHSLKLQHVNPVHRITTLPYAHRDVHNCRCKAVSAWFRRHRRSVRAHEPSHLYSCHRSVLPLQHAAGAAQSCQCPCTSGHGQPRCRIARLPQSMSTCTPYAALPKISWASFGWTSKEHLFNEMSQPMHLAPTSP